MGVFFLSMFFIWVNSMQHIIIPENAEKVRILAVGLPSHYELEQPEEIAAFWLTRKNIDPIYNLKKVLLGTEDEMLQAIGDVIPHGITLYEVPSSIRELHTDKVYICQP